MTRTLRCDHCGRTVVDDGTVLVMQRVGRLWLCRDVVACNHRVLETTGQMSIAGPHPSFDETMTQLRIGGSEPA